MPKFHSRLSPGLSVKKILVIITAITLFVIFLSQTDFLLVKEINVEVITQSCVQESQIKSSFNLYGKNILFIDYNNQVNVLKEKYKCIKSIEISPIYPDKLKLKIYSRNAKFALSSIKLKEASLSAIANFTDRLATESASVMDIDGESFMVDEEGVIFAVNERTDLIRVYLVKGFPLGERIDMEMARNISEVIEECRSLELNLDRMIVEGHDLFVDSSPDLVLRLNANLDQQIAALHLILKKAKIDGIKVEFIDLRFDKPVVKYGER